MNLTFGLDTHGTCVGQLKDELLPLTESAEAWTFPYHIDMMWRVLPESYERKSFRRFDSRDQTLTLDISIPYEQYLRMSKNEQREALGIVRCGSCILQWLQYREGDRCRYDAGISRAVQGAAMRRCFTEQLRHLDGRLRQSDISESGR